MKTKITLHTELGALSWPAIVRGDLALHTTPDSECRAVLRRDGRPCWTITHIPTGLAVMIVVGCAAGRLTFRSVRWLDYGRRDARLLKKLNTQVQRLREAGVETVLPRPNRFFVLSRRAQTAGLANLHRDTGDQT